MREEDTSFLWLPRQIKATSFHFLTTFSGNKTMAQAFQIPTTLLSQDGVEPAKGDSVEVTVTATVDDVRDGVASVTPTAINGQEIPQEQAELDEAQMDERDKRLASELDEASLTA
jgi:hypothetical protein